MLYKALLFLVVGLFSSAAYLTVMTVSAEVLGLSVFISAFLAFCTGTMISYLGNTLFTFRAAMRYDNLARFLLIVMIGLGFNQAVAYGLDRIGVHYTIIALAVFVTVPVINFIGHSVFTYQEKRQ